ncbi:MAG: phosphatase domain-containing protein, partial [Actinomycetota bacterium]
MPSRYCPPTAPDRLHRSARAEDRLHSVVERVLRRRGWRPRILPYVGYGYDGWVRVLARVQLAPPGVRRRDIERGRGWRRYFCATATGLAVTVQIGDTVHEVVSGRGGYIDQVVDVQLPPGWATALLSAKGCRPAEATVRVVSAAARIGIVSDIDDTVVITAMPRPLLAIKNSMLLHEVDRRPVPGMALLYQSLIAPDPESFVVY